MAKPNVKLTQTSVPSKRVAPTPPKGVVRVRLQQGERTLSLSKVVSPKNGAIRVKATISVKNGKAAGLKPLVVGREVFTTHDLANKALDRLTKDAVERGWILRKKGEYATIDKVIVIPDAVEATS